MWIFTYYKKDALEIKKRAEVVAENREEAKLELENEHQALTRNADKKYDNNFDSRTFSRYILC